MLRNGTIVERGGLRGLVVNDRFGLCEPGESMVAWHDQAADVLEAAESDRSLDVITDEKPQPTPEHCGAGRGEDCCVWLVCGAKGLECARTGHLRHTLIARAINMNAKRQPSAPFPDCAAPAKEDR